ncbi:unnamed protein product [Symbiodinium pilosum]|uniref:Uncharacterized protein n=1 Tax=Symbiodinium pilosum TaxID=2952 RepID=A0A812P9W3_SYMPI|nr:unnamed protein product [Symbiodinium pilosum]
MQERGISAVGVVGGHTALDLAPDLECDGVNLAMNSRQMLTEGKYRRKKTVAEVYQEDKSYVKGVRGHGYKDKLTGPLLQFKAYIEYRDVAKFNRLALSKAMPSQAVTASKPDPTVETSGRMTASPTKRRAKKEADKLESPDTDSGSRLKVEENPCCEALGDPCGGADRPGRCQVEGDRQPDAARPREGEDDCPPIVVNCKTRRKLSRAIATL